MTRRNGGHRAHQEASTSHPAEMVPGRYAKPPIAAHSNQREPQQRPLRKIEAPSPVLGEQLFQPPLLLILGDVSPVQLNEWQVDRAPHDLQRLLQTLP